MELIEQLKADGISKGLCLQWQGKLRKGLKLEQLVELYIKGINFCIKNEYPTLDFLRQHFKGKCEPYGVYIDDEVTDSLNESNIVLNGACKAILDYDDYIVARAYIRHNSEAGVDVDGNALVTIDVFDNAILHLSVIGKASKVILNVYGKNVKVDFNYYNHATQDQVKATYHNNTAY